MTSRPTLHTRVIQVGGGGQIEGGEGQPLVGSYVDDEEKDNHKSPSALESGLASVPEKDMSMVNEGADIPIKWPTFGAATQIELSTNR